MVAKSDQKAVQNPEENLNPFLIRFGAPPGTLRAAKTKQTHEAFIKNRGFSFLSFGMAFGRFLIQKGRLWAPKSHLKVVQKSGPEKGGPQESNKSRKRAKKGTQGDGSL